MNPLAEVGIIVGAAMLGALGMYLITLAIARIFRRRRY
jgi:hypothetical protein